MNIYDEINNFTLNEKNKEFIGNIFVEKFNLNCEVNFDANVPKEYVKNCINYINQMPDEMFQKICDLLINDCNYYRHEDTEINLPDKIIGREIINYISGLSIQIYNHPQKDIVGFCICGNCKWNEEHGFIIVINNGKVVYYGENDNLYYPWEFERNTNGIEKNNNINNNFYRSEKPIIRKSKKEEIKNILKGLLFILMFCGTGLMLTVESFNTHNFFYIIVAIPMYLLSIFFVYAIVQSVINLTKKDSKIEGTITENLNKENNMVQNINETSEYIEYKLNDDEKEIVYMTPMELFKSDIEGSTYLNLNIKDCSEYDAECVKNLYKMILACGEFENPYVDEYNLEDYLKNEQQVIELVRKFPEVNKSHFKNDLNYLTFSLEDEEKLKRYIEILRKSFKNNRKKLDKELKPSGWDAITNEAERVYPGQTNPKHYGAIIKWRFGGPDPLDGISIYDGGDYWHFVTYGLSELYEKKSNEKEISGYGMEFTLKLKKGNYANEEAELKCICGILQSLAKLTFTKGEVFNEYEYIYSGQTEGIDSGMSSNITGFITIPDTKFNVIDTTNGKVKFVELIGVTREEIMKIYNKEIRVKELYEKLGSDITEYDRKSVV